ncbi:MAG: SPASM domain-containing protein, partial [bacterium]
GIHFTATKTNYMEFPAVLSLAGQINIKKITAAGLYAWDDSFKKAELDYKEFCQGVGSEESLKKRFPDREITVMLLNRFKKRGRPHCNQPWHLLFIDSAGKALPCCQQISNCLPQGIGNINDQPLKDIWNSQAMVDFRKKMYSGRAQACERCFLR